MPANPQLTSIITSAANANGIPPLLALAQAQKESSFNPNAYNNSSGATGLFQLEPATAAQLGVTNPLDPVQSANGGTAYLAQMYAQFGSWELALAAYDWGPGNLQKALNAYGPDWLAHAPAETQNYVTSILDSSGMSATASVTPASIANGVAQTLFPAPSDSTDSTDSIDVTDASLAPAGGGPNLVLLGAAALAVYFAVDMFFGD
jgi:hypothetical protein